MAGPLTGIRIVELGGLGPAPFAAMVLSDLGADVLRVERPDRVQMIPSDTPPEELVRWDLISRGRPCAAVDLKQPDGVSLVRRLASVADVLIEGFRPGVAERLGVGPGECCESNDRLVYGRMTGWGRTGPLADRPGHDISYLSVAGVLAHIGREGELPTPPLNLVADFGGGGMLLAMGVCAALVERSVSGRGQVVDAAMVDGAALLMAPLFGAHATGFWSDDRGTNLLDSGAPFYDCYRCSDDAVLSVGAIEPQFYEALLVGLGLAGDELPGQHEVASWPQLRGRFVQAFASRTRAEWLEVFDGSDACVAPVLTMGEAPAHPQLREWGTFVDVGGTVQPGPAPRFSRTPPSLPTRPRLVGEDTDSALAAWGVDAPEIERLRGAKVIA